LIRRLYIWDILYFGGMKLLLSLALLTFAVAGYGQQVFSEFGAIGSFYKNSGHAFGGQLNVNFQNKHNALLGFGVSALSFKGLDGAYLPVYGRIGSYFPTADAIITVHVDAGYGIYNQKVKEGTVFIETKGGLYLSPGVSIHGKKNVSPYLDLRYSLYQFSTTLAALNSSSHINALTASFGFALVNKHTK
jgi:hypothetical protein